jgi:hypothetical protein
MSVGFELYDSSGGVVLNATDRVLKILGYTVVSGYTSSYTDARLSTYAASPYSNSPSWFWVGDQFGPENWMPNIYISGSTIYWVYGPTPGGFTNAVGRIFYGVY